MAANQELSKIAKSFDIEGELSSITPYGSGHINKTFVSRWILNGSEKRYVHQLINDKIFLDVENLMQNISKVLTHLNAKVDGENYKQIKIIKTKSGALYLRDEVNRPWRTYSFIEGTRYVEVCRKAREVYEAGRIIGYFQKQLIDLDVSSLNENIRDFTSSPHRVNQFESALQKTDRIPEAKNEVKFGKDNALLAGLIEDRLKSERIPRRVVHGDTKINNVLFSENSEKAVCLVDLDTCMPGYSLFDFGDLARSISFNVEEDEQDFSKIVFNKSYFESLAEGYLLNAKDFLNSDETEVLHIVPQLIAYTLGLRFLTDFLNHDIYFNIKRPKHNLERARTQFRICTIFKENEDLMRSIIQSKL